MPLHDWTRVDAGVFHDVHGAWITELRRVLNGGGLPPGFYAMGDQVLGGATPDVLALGLPTPPNSSPTNGSSRVDAVAVTPSAIGLMTAPPRTRTVTRAIRESYTAKQRSLAILHRSGHRVVALIEILSAGNKGSSFAWQQFLDKALAVLHRGIHLLIIDPYPPTPRDPNGVHGAIWEALTYEAYDLPTDANRTLVSYSAGPVKTAYIEPIAVGQVLPDMPLFLSEDGEGYVQVPLESTYQAAYAPLAQYYRDTLESHL